MHAPAAVGFSPLLFRSPRWRERRQPGGIEWARGQCIDPGGHHEIGLVQPADLSGGQRYFAKAPSQRELRVMPDFLCKSAHRVGKRQGGAIVAKLEAALDAACRRVKFPIGNLGEIECTLFARERVDAASARNAGTLRERRHHSFTLWRPPLYPTSRPIHRVSRTALVFIIRRFRLKRAKESAFSRLAT
jgi:hypothetical protein